MFLHQAFDEICGMRVGPGSAKAERQRIEDLKRRALEEAGPFGKQYPRFCLPSARVLRG